MIVDIEEKGCQDGSLRDAILEALYLLRLPLAVVRVKLRLPTSSIINWAVLLSGTNRSNLQVQAASTAVSDVISVCLVQNCLFFLHSRQYEIFAIIIYELCWGGIDSVWVSKGGMWKKLWEPLAWTNWRFLFNVAMHVLLSEKFVFSRVQNFCRWACECCKYQRNWKW